MFLDKLMSLTPVTRRIMCEQATELLSAQPFWAAENYHQNYHAKHGI